MACAPSEDSDQPGHPPSLISVFAVRMKKAWVLSYPMSAQRRLWSDWADAQAVLSLRWAHSHCVGFVMRRLSYTYDCMMQLHTPVNHFHENSLNFLTVCRLFKNIRVSILIHIRLLDRGVPKTRFYKYADAALFIIVQIKFADPMGSMGSFWVISGKHESRHDKTNKTSVRPAKTQISLCIRPVWSESSLSSRRNLGSLATHWAHSEDSDQTGRMPSRIWVFAGRTVTVLVLSCRGSHYYFKDLLEGVSSVAFYNCCSWIDSIKPSLVYFVTVNSLPWKMRERVLGFTCCAQLRACKSWRWDLSFYSLSRKNRWTDDRNSNSWTARPIR